MSIFFEYPTIYRPVISEEDRRYGTIHRYFCRRRTSTSPADIVEVSEDTFGSIGDNPMYIVVDMEWKISGQLENQKVGNTVILGVIDANKKSIEIASKTMKNLDYILLNYSEFYNA